MHPWHRKYLHCNQIRLSSWTCKSMLILHSWSPERSVQSMSFSADSALTWVLFSVSFVFLLRNQHFLLHNKEIKRSCPPTLIYLFLEASCKSYKQGKYQLHLSAQMLILSCQIVQDDNHQILTPRALWQRFWIFIRRECCKEKLFTFRSGIAFRPMLWFPQPLTSLLAAAWNCEEFAQPTCSCFGVSTA